jgi:c(7)-type cytochrome triheme protein
MANIFRKFFNSKLTTLALIAGLGAVGFAVFGGFGGKEAPAKSAERAAEPVAQTASATSPVAGSEEAVGAAPEGPDGSAGEGDGAEAVAAAPSGAEEAAPEFIAVSDQSPSARRAASAPAPDPARLAAAADASGANSFNRLLRRPASAPNASPARDGIHDTDNPGTSLLQWPSVAFEGLPKTADGNKVDWVKALESGKIKPRYELADPNAEPFLLDLVIVRQVKGSMPNVVYPHLAHTQWLDCSNCHDEIFTPQKGANQISMAGILLGQKCGVCHGKVAFPVSDCRRCHAQPKTEEELRALASRSSWTNDSGD